MKVLIVGLGLIGGAYAYRLSQKKYEVYGCDIDSEAISYAEKKQYILEGSTDPKKYIEQCDCIILGIYPQAILHFLETYRKYFKKNQYITDVCGVKSSFVEQATVLAEPAIYCSHHPMAGKEKVGISYSEECVFEGANFLITPLDRTPKSIVEFLKGLGKDLGFSKITVISIDRHDKMIGFTSQLTHAIAVALVNSDEDMETKNFIGDSYRDLTRIAEINERLWSELFLENREYLLDHIRHFEEKLNEIQTALIQKDKEALKTIFIASAKKRREMEK